MFKNKLLLTNIFFKTSVLGIVQGGFIVIVSCLSISIQPKSVEAVQLFRDDFNDNIVDTSIYSSINGAAISEANGRMDVAFNTVGDGILFSLDKIDFAVNCFDLHFTANSFSVGQGININFLLSDLQESDDLNVSFSITQTASILAQIDIIRKDGSSERIFEKYPDLSMIGNHTVTYDPKIWSAGWKVDNGNGAPVNVLNFFQDFLNQKISDSEIKNKQIKQVKITLISTDNRDPIISIDTLQIQDTHSVPEPFTIIGTLTGATAAFRMRKKLKAISK